MWISIRLFGQSRLTTLECGTAGLHRIPDTPLLGGYVFIGKCGAANVIYQPQGNKWQTRGETQRFVIFNVRLSFSWSQLDKFCSFADTLLGRNSIQRTGAKFRRCCTANSRLAFWGRGSLEELDSSFLTLIY